MDQEPEPPLFLGESTGVSPLDVAQMIDVTGGDAKLVWDLFLTFRKEATRHIETLRQAAQTGDITAARDAAHSIKGSAATMGYNQIRDVARTVELHAKAGELEQAAAKSGEIEAAIGRLEQAVKSFDQIKDNPDMA